MKKNIILLRQNVDDLKPEEIQLLNNAFPGCELNFIRTDPRNYQEHVGQCHDSQAAAVVLPKEKPIPSDAMEAGFAHLAFTPNGLKKLVELQPVFEEFKP